MPTLILIITAVMWWWSDREERHRHDALHDSVQALVIGQLRQMSTAPTKMRLRWADPAMQAVFLAGLPDLGERIRTPQVIVHSDEADPAGRTPVEIKGSMGSIILEITPMDDLQLGVIQSVVRPSHEAASASATP
ncbi:MAG: hypothetical protein MK101_02150 [Phycisphaerales bacterium]|nr:hypothetical protein [Phycisphaerales bacterium]